MKSSSRRSAGRPLLAAAFAVLANNGAAFAAVQTGIPDGDVLFGTNGRDVLNGGGGDSDRTPRPE